MDVSLAASFLGDFTGFAGGDQIDLIDLADTSFSFASGVLTVMNYSTVVAALHFDGSYATGSFSLTPDGHSGTLIKFV